MKKLLALITVFVMVISCCVMGVGTVASAAEESPAMDFMIFDGVIEEYIGPGGVVVIPRSLGITEIAAKAFYQNEYVTEVIIPEGVEIIGERAFHHCANLEKVELPYSLIEIGGNTFAKCTSLTEITIPAQLEVIPAWAFSTCTALKSVKFSYGVKEIHNQAFCALYGLKKVVFPETVEIIATGAFNCQMDTQAVEYIICNPDCEVGLFNETYQGNIEHKWEANVYKTPFQSSYGVVTYKIVVPENSAVEKFFNEKGAEMFDNDDTSHKDTFRLIPKPASYFEELPENKKTYGIQAPAEAENNDNKNENVVSPGNPDNPSTDDKTPISGNNTEGNNTNNNSSNVSANNNVNQNKGANSSEKNSTGGIDGNLLIIVAGILIVVMAACVMTAVILYAPGRRAKKEKPLSEEEIRAKLLAEMQEEKPAEPNEEAKEEAAE